MRIKLTLFQEKPVILEKGFIYYIQSFIFYNLIKEKTKWLHDNGFIHEKGQRFKLFCFSSILEKGYFDKNKNLFIFPERISFLISSPVKWILEDFISNVIFRNDVFLGKNILKIESIEVIKKINFNSDKIKITTISPIEVHTTVNKENDLYNYSEDNFNKKIKKKTIYFSPFEKEFNKRINENIKKKWEVMFKNKCPYDLTIKPLFTMDDVEKNKYKYKIVSFFKKGGNFIVINGWKGNFEIEGDPEIINFAYDTGLGSRNSQGFGMWTPIYE